MRIWAYMIFLKFWMSIATECILKILNYKNYGSRRTWQQRRIICVIPWSLKLEKTEWRMRNVAWDAQIWACVKYLKCNFSRLQIWRISDCLPRATQNEKDESALTGSYSLSAFICEQLQLLFCRVSGARLRRFFFCFLSVSIVGLRSIDKMQRSKLAMRIRAKKRAEYFI